MTVLLDGVVPADVTHLVNERAPRLTCQYPIPRFDGTAMSRQQAPGEQPPGLHSLDEVEQLLDATFAEAQPPMADMERLVSALGTAAQLDRLFTDVTGDRERLALVSADSEKHPLGFYKIPLLSKPEYQLRLNIRPGSQAARPRFGRRSVLGERLNGKQDIHNHRFDFASKVLVGNLVTWIYEFTDEPPLQFHTMQQIWDSNNPIEAKRSLDWFARQGWRIANGYPEEHEPRPVQIFRADQQDKNTEAMELVETGYARLIYNAIIRAGGIYSLSHRTFHRDWPLLSSDLTATLFLRGRPDFESDTIARILPVEEGGRTERPKERMTSREVKVGLTGLRGLIAA